VLNVSDTNGDMLVDEAEIDAALAARVSFTDGALSIDSSVWFKRLRGLCRH
jgi:hypothetical protein